MLFSGSVMPGLPHPTDGSAPGLLFLLPPGVRSNSCCFFTAPDTAPLSIISALSQPLHSLSNCPMLFPQSILDTFRFGGGGGSSSGVISFAFSIVHRVVTVRILEWVTIPSSSGPCFARTLCCDPAVLGGPAPPGS